MENTTSRNSIILRNIKSPYIEQAIIILKNGNYETISDDIVTEAQKIIDKFIIQRKRESKIRSVVSKILRITAVMSAISAVFISLYILL